MEEMRVPLAKQAADGLAASTRESEEKVDDEKDLEMQQRNRADSYGTVERRKEEELEPIKERYWFFHCAMASGASSTAAAGAAPIASVPAASAMVSDFIVTYLIACEAMTHEIASGSTTSDEHIVGPQKTR